jgi:hypothetical protein
MVQLARRARVPPPERQAEVIDANGHFVAFVDLPATTARRLVGVVDQARRRPLTS